MRYAVWIKIFIEHAELWELLRYLIQDLIPNLPSPATFEESF